MVHNDLGVTKVIFKILYIKISIYKLYLHCSIIIHGHDIIISGLHPVDAFHGQVKGQARGPLSIA